MLRRLNTSPSPSYTESRTYTDEDSIDDAAEVEAALGMVEDEIEDALTQWSQPYTSTTTLDSVSHASEDVYSTTNTLLDRERRVLSTISEHTENLSSRPNSFTQSGQGSRPNTHYSAGSAGDRRSANLEPSSAHSVHARAATEPALNPPLTPSRPRPATPGSRAGELIAFFEDKVASPVITGPLRGHSRNASVPIGPRSPSPYTMTNSQTFPSLTYTSSSGYGYGSTTGYGSITGYGSGTGYGSSRPSSPTKSRTGSAVSSSLLSPPPRASTTLSSDSRFLSSHTRSGSVPFSSTGSYTGSDTYTGTRTSTGTDTYTRSSTDTYTATRTGTGSNTYTTSNPTTYTTSNPTTYTSTLTRSTLDTTTTTTATPTISSLRRPQTSPRSPLTSVRNIVAAWKERTPSLSKSVRSSASSPSPSQSQSQNEGLFSVRRRAERGSVRLRERALQRRLSDPLPPDPDADVLSGSGSGSGAQPPPLDIAELRQYANIKSTQEVRHKVHASH